MRDFFLIIFFVFRIKKRGRNEEDAVTKEYQIDLLKRQEEWLNQNHSDKILEFPDCEFEKNSKNFENMVVQMENFIKQLQKNSRQKEEFVGF